MWIKAVYSASWETHLRATGRHLPYVLPATRHKWTRPALTLARQAVTRSTYPGGMEGWVDLGIITARPGIEHTTAWSQVRRPNRYATKPTGFKYSWRKVEVAEQEKTVQRQGVCGLSEIIIRGQSKGERGGTAFPHLLFSVCIVPPPEF